MATMNLTRVTLHTTGDTYVQSAPATPEAVDNVVEFLMHAARYSGHTLKSMSFEDYSVEVEDTED